MKRRSRYKNPNILQTDERLDYSARNVGRVFFAFCNALGRCRKSYDELARLAGCSRTTAVKAVQQLIDAGYITRCHTTRWDDKLGRPVNARNLYFVDLKVLDSGYTLISRESFTLGLSDFAAVLYAQVLTEAGNTNRAFPSISRLQKATGATRATVCAGLKLLKKLSVLLVQLCMKRSGTFASSSYILMSGYAVISTHAEEVSDCPVSIFIKWYFTIKSAVCKALNGIISLFSWE